MSFEQKINYQLNKYPAVKRVIKRVYQTGMYAISKKIKSEGNITRISPDDSEHEYFFGYYDKSPWDISDKYMLCLKANDTWSDVSPKEKADILLIDTERNESDPKRVRKIAETAAWNVQQSCMLQWLGPDFKNRILFNDYREGKYVSVILNLKTMKEKVIPAPVYTVSSDGKFALTLDFSRLYNLRPGYGYYNVPEKTKDVSLPKTAAIWKVSLETGEVTEVLKYTDFATFQPRYEMQEKGTVHKVNHLMLSPNNKRFMVLYRWFNGERKYTRLITCNVDGTDMYVLSDDDMVSHCFWKNDNEIIAFENKKHGGAGYYLMRDKTEKYYHCWKELTGDGHPSFSPDRKLVVTDSYPDRARIQYIKVMDGDVRKTGIKIVAKVFSPFKYDNDTRCDLHPRWNHAGNKICFDSVFEGHRGLYEVKLEGNVMKNKIKLNDEILEHKRRTVCVLLSTYNGEKYLKEQLDSLLWQENVELKIFIRDDGSKDSTLQILDEYSKKDSRITYFVGDNRGPAQSFFDLIINSPDADYYAFCDQDDVWDKDKLEIAIDFLEKEDDSKPNMYYSNLRIVDQNLQYYRLSHSTPSVQNNKYSALTEDMATGCTVVFNKTAANFVRSGSPKYCSMHDTWIYMICKFFGKTIYDFDAHISYRQHENNVVGTYLGKKTKEIYVARIKRLFNRELQPRYNNACNFYKTFGDILESKDKEKVLKIVNYKKSLLNKLSLLFDKEIYASSRNRELRYKLLIILGIV